MHLDLFKRSVPDPAFFIDARGGQVRIFDGNRPMVAQVLAEHFPEAGKMLAEQGDPRGKYPVVVATDTGVEFFMGETWGWRIFRSCRERAEVEFLRARKRGITDPAILINTRGQEERKRRMEGQRQFPEGWEMAHATFAVGSRPRIAGRLSAISRGAAEFVAGGPPPQLPFTVVVVGDQNLVEVFNQAEPEAGDYEDIEEGGADGIGPDDVLDLDVPMKASEGNLLVATRPTTRTEWREFIRRTAGSIPDPDFRRHEQGEFEERAPL
jgi:hypothetical protein